MPPPPKPPVICYDLQTNTNARRAPCSRYRVSAVVGTSCKSKVTVIPTSEKNHQALETDTCWHHSYEHEADDEFENSHRPPTRYRSIYHTTTNTPATTIQREPRPQRQPILRQQYHRQPTTTLTDQQRRQRAISAFGTTLNSNCDHSTVARETIQRQQQVRYEYDQKLKEKLRQKERLEERRRQEAAMKAELDAITLKLESVKRVHENLEHTYGMSHNAARYFQKTDEEYANLRRKLDQFAQIRSKDAEKQLQEKKRLYKYQQHEDRQVELRRLRDMSSRLATAPAHNKPQSHKLTSTLNGSLSPSSQTPSSSSLSTTRNSPSSTISISTCSSPLSSCSVEEQLLPPRHQTHNSHYVARKTVRHQTPPTSARRPVSSSTPSASRAHHNSAARLHSSSILKPERPLMDFSFYKGPPQDDRETLEVTDLNFLDKIEDKTMLEVNELLGKMQSVLNDSYQQEQELLHAGSLNNNNNNIDHDANISARLRSQMDHLAENIRTSDLIDYCEQPSYLRD